MRKKDDIDRVWDIIEQVSVCMLTTQFVGGLRARPLEARPDRYAGLIYFVTDIHSAKEDEIKATPDVGLVFIDPNDKAYLSITAAPASCAMLTKATWRKTDEVWWPGGPHDPDVCLLRIEPPRNCGMDQRALSLLPSSSPRRGQPGRRRSSARTER